MEINYKTHGKNICLDCPMASKFSPKNRTCYCAAEEERTKCVTECDDYNYLVKGIKTECGIKKEVEK